MQELRTALEDVADSDARVLVVRGAGVGVFVSGGDLKELGAIRTLDQAVEMATEMRGVLDQLATLPIPVIAALNGHAYGGGAEVAVACDIRIAADDVKCAFNQVKLGIMPAWGGIERLTSLVGRGRALKLMVTGCTVAANEAFEMGLFDVVVPRSRFEDHYQEVAHEIMSVPRDALIGIKAAQQAAFPTARPDLAPAAVTSFAQTWVADEHWQMLEDTKRRRQAAGRQA
jgi:enoyl-CoA hydratase/carnithine racemase